MMSGLSATARRVVGQADEGKNRPLDSTTRDDRFIGMFSYGSNSEQQLRARCKSPALRGYPAYLDGYVRVFGFDSPPVSWGGSVASVAPKAGGRVYGCFYLMTPREVAILDLYEHVKEGGYLKEPVMAMVRVSSTSSMEDQGGKQDGNGKTSPPDGHGDDDDNFVMTPAITYVMSEHFVRTFVQPSPQYLTAVYRTLTLSFPELLGVPLEVCDYTGTKRSEWTYPGPKHLPLKAFLLEVALQEQPPWTTPYTLNLVASRLEAAGIMTTEGLCDAAADGTLSTRFESAASTKAEEVEARERDGVAGVSSSTPLAVTESYRQISSSISLPELTQRTVDIIARLASTTTT